MIQENEVNKCLPTYFYTINFIDKDGRTQTFTTYHYEKQKALQAFARVSDCNPVSVEEKLIYKA